jgi:hypothetical protein
MPSRRSRSSGRRRSRRRSRGVDVYLFPAVVGGGIGDIEEVLAAGRRLAAAGQPVRLYRRPGRPLPREVDGPWEWPALDRVSRVVPTHRVALSITPAFGLSAAPESAGPLGRPGPWSEEAANLERAYGAEQVVHASLEEFARTLTVREEDRERWREGGARWREIGRRTAGSAGRRDRATFTEAFRRFRAFGRPNVLTLFAGFAPSPQFARQFPEAIQTGPLWSGLHRPRTRTPPARRRSWVWYASPSSAETIAPGVFAGLTGVEPPVRLSVRTPRPWKVDLPGESVEIVRKPMTPDRWRAAFAAADLRIVTGSRSLLEALEVGGPFLYFNGVLGRGSARRRHRPEKIIALLRAAHDAGWPFDLRRDLADFARGRRIAAVVRRAARREGAWRAFPPTPPVVGYPPDRADLGEFLVRLASALARPDSVPVDLVQQLRSGATLPA